MLLLRAELPRVRGALGRLHVPDGERERQPHDRPRPEVALLRAADRQVLNLLGRFGLTPSDRSNVSASADPRSNPDDEFRDDEFR